MKKSMRFIMTDEKLLVKIKFVIDMYSVGADTVDGALEKIFDLVDGYEEEATE